MGLPGEHQIPPALVAEIASGRAVLIAGAGLSKHARELPLWGEFGRLIRDRIPHATDDDVGDANLESYLLEYLEFAKTRYTASYDGAIRQLLSSDNDGVSRSHALIARLPWKAVITTNLDTLIEDAFRAADREIIVVADEKGISRIPEARGTLILKMHGSVDIGEQVLTFGEYHDFDLHRQALKAVLLSYLARYPTVICGAGLRDPNFLKLYSVVHDAFRGFQQPAFYLGHGVPSFVRSIWGQRKFNFVDVPHENLTEWLEELALRVEGARQTKGAGHAAFSVNKHIKHRSLIGLGVALSRYAKLQQMYTDSVQMPDYGWFKEQWDRTLYAPLRSHVRRSLEHLHNAPGSAGKMSFLYCAPGPHAPILASPQSEKIRRLLKRVVLADIDEFVLEGAVEGARRMDSVSFPVDSQRLDFTGGLGQRLCENLALALEHDTVHDVSQALRACLERFPETFQADKARLVPEIASAFTEGKAQKFDVSYSEMVAAFTGTAVAMAFRSALYARFRYGSCSEDGISEALGLATLLWQRFNDHMYSVHLESLAAVTRPGGLVLVSFDTKKIFDDSRVDSILSFERGARVEGLDGLRFLPDLARGELSWRDHEFGGEMTIAGRAISDFKPHRHQVAFYAFRRE